MQVGLLTHNLFWAYPMGASNTHAARKANGSKRGRVSILRRKGPYSAVSN